MVWITLDSLAVLGSGEGENKPCGTCSGLRVKIRKAGDGMILYYREGNGDYLAIDTATNRCYLTNFGQDRYEGRATAIFGVIGSVCWTGISRQYLRQKCQRVARRNVPGKWLRAIGLCPRRRLRKQRQTAGLIRRPWTSSSRGSEGARLKVCPSSP
jgi:hypothetical protein